MLPCRWPYRGSASWAASATRVLVASAGREARPARFGASRGPGACARLADSCRCCRCRYLEDSYITYDPFAVRKRPLCLGSNCSVCGEPVCAGDTCSLFYAKRFCKPCAQRHRGAFPPQCHKLAPAIFGQPAPQ